MARNTIFYVNDPHGVPLVGVGLSNRRRAWLYHSDFERIDALYPDGRWGVTHNSQGRVFVRIRPSGTQKNVYVARLVAGDFERTVVRYRDGDSMNLRRTNLKHDIGGGGRPRRRTLTARTALLIPTYEAGDPFTRSLGGVPETASRLSKAR